MNFNLKLQKTRNLYFGPKTQKNNFFFNYSVFGQKKILNERSGK